jgi:hypothetical protein
VGVVGGLPLVELIGGGGAQVRMYASPGELHVDDAAWRPEQPAGGAVPVSGPEEGEVTIALEDAGVEVLVGT